MQRDGLRGITQLPSASRVQGKKRVAEETEEGAAKIPHKLLPVLVMGDRGKLRLGAASANPPTWVTIGL